MRAMLAGFVFCTLILSACTEQEILRYQDRPAETALECEAAYRAARQRGNSAYVDTSSGASVLGAALGKGMAKGMIESAYRNCLARVANAVEPSNVSVVEVEPVRNYRRAIEPQEHRPVACPANSNVLYGGTQYCLKR